MIAIILYFLTISCKNKDTFDLNRKRSPQRQYSMESNVDIFRQVKDIRRASNNYILENFESLNQDLDKLAVKAENSRLNSRYQALIKNEITYLKSHVAKVKENSSI